MTFLVKQAETNLDSQFLSQTKLSEKNQNAIKN